MTDLTLIRGDSKNYRVTVVDDNAAPIDLTDSVVKFAVKRRAKDANEDAVIFKASYEADQILIDDPVNGRLLIFIITADTYDEAAGTYCWDIETTRQDGLKTSAGAITVTSGSGILVGAALDLTAIKPGDLLLPAGATPANQKQITILDIGGSGLTTDPGAGNLLTDYEAWDNEAAVTIQVFKGNRKTPNGLSGAFVITQDVTN